MNRASISIFPNKIEYTDSRSRPDTPPEVFEAALRVAISKTCELVRTGEGMYIIDYSETGPTNRREGWEGWLPVYVAKIQRWSSGGVKQEEMDKHLAETQEECPQEKN